MIISNLAQDVDNNQRVSLDLSPPIFQGWFVSCVISLSMVH